MLRILRYFLEKNQNNHTIFSQIMISTKEETNINFHLILIKIYLKSDNQDLLNIIKEILELQINNVNVNKKTFDYLSQVLSEYFNDVKSPAPNSKIINKYLDIYKLLYGERLNASKPKNYFYMSGTASIVVNSKKLDKEKLKITNVIFYYIFIKGICNFSMVSN
jgi:hypothetical protein